MGADTYRSYRSNVVMNNGAKHQTMQKYHIPTAAAAMHLLCSVETLDEAAFGLPIPESGEFFVDPQVRGRVAPSRQVGDWGWNGHGDPLRIVVAVRRRRKACAVEAGVVR